MIPADISAMCRSVGTIKQRWYFGSFWTARMDAN